MRQNCTQVVLENFFEPCILLLLTEEPSYGYQLVKKLKDNNLCNVNIGNLYRKLNRLVKNNDISKKTVKSDFGPKKIIYTITPKGKKLLKNWINELEKQEKSISKLIKSYKNKYD